MAENTLRKLFKDIAEAIRSKTGGQDEMTPMEFPERIENIEGGGGSTIEGTATVTFCNYDGTKLYSRLVFIDDDCPEPVAQNKMDEPTRDSDVQYNYTFDGWSDTQDGDVSETVLKNITADKTVYAVYTASLVKYTARFFDGETLRETLTVAYGETAQPSTEKSEHIFIGWTPSNLTIYGDTDFYGTWNKSALLEHASWATIAEYAADGTAATRYKLGDTKEITLTWEDGTTETVTAQLVGFNHDKANLEDENSETLPMSFIIKDLLNNDIKWNNKKIEIGWHASSSCAWFNNELFNALPSELQSVIKTTSKKCSYRDYKHDEQVGYAKVKCWLPSCNELNSTLGYNSTYIFEDGEPYELFNDITKSQLIRKQDGQASSYITRSRLRPSSSSVTTQYGVYGTFASGSFATYAMYTDSTNAMPFGFCI